MFVGGRVVSLEEVCDVPTGTLGTIVHVFPHNLPFRYEVDFDELPGGLLVTSKEISLAPN